MSDRPEQPGQKDINDVLAMAYNLSLPMNAEQASAFAVRYAVELHAGVFELSFLSFKIAYEEFMGNCPMFFEVREYSVETRKRGNDRTTQAKVKVSIGSHEELTVDDGIGPVDAFARALKKALSSHYSGLSEMRLVGYSLSAIDVQNETTAAPVVVRAKFEFVNAACKWEVAATSDNQDEAGLHVLIASFRWALHSTGAHNKHHL